MAVLPIDPMAKQPQYLTCRLHELRVRSQAIKGQKGLWVLIVDQIHKVLMSWTQVEASLSRT